LVLGFGFSLWTLSKERLARQRVEATVVRLEMERADTLFSQDRTAAGAAQLARLLRRHPDNRVIAERLLSALGVLDSSRSLAASSTNLIISNGKGGGRRQPLALEFACPGTMPGGVGWAEFSPDGQTVLTVWADFTVRIWDARTGQPVSQPMLHRDSVRLAHFSPEGRLVATASADASARVWDAHTGQPLTAPLPHGDRVLDVRFSPDGRWIVTASADGTARVWETRTGQPVGRRLQHRKDPAASLETDECAAEFGESTELEPSDVLLAKFSPDGRRVVTTCRDGEVRVWDPATGQLIVGPLAHQRSVAHVRVSPDGSRLVTVDLDGTARVWDLRTGQPLAEPIPQLPGLATDPPGLSPDGSRIILLSRNTAQVCDLRSGTPVGSPMAQAARLVTAQFSPDGTRVVLGSVTGVARVWDVMPALPVSGPLPHGGEVRHAEFSPDGQWLLTVSSDGRARIWEVQAAPAPVPRWLPELAEAVVGQRVGENDVREPVSPGQLENLRQELTARAGTDFYTRWAKWFFVADSTRTLSPASAIPVSEYVQWRIVEGTPESLREAVRLAPTNAVALDRLGAVTLLAQIESLDRNGRSAEALALAEEGLLKHTPSVRLWHTKGDLLAKTGQPQAANQAYTQAINLANTNAHLLALCRNVLAQRAEDIWGRRRIAESRADFGKLLEVMCPTARECRDIALQGKYRALLDGQPYRGFEDLWDLDRLLMLAERAVRLDPTDWKNYRLLGMAQYRDQQFAAAAETFQAEGRTRGGNLSARSLFFLAMTHQRLHEPEPARVCFERARQSWQTTFQRLPSSQQAEFVSLQVEAERVLQPGGAKTQWGAEDLKRADRIWKLIGQGTSLAPDNRLDEALAAFEKAIELAGADTNVFEQALTEARQNRSAVLRRLNRLTEAGVENCLARDIPLRDPQARPELVDLSLFYNGTLTQDMQNLEISPGIRNDLSALRPGVQKLGSVEFEVRGLINLSGTFLSRSRMRRFPTAVTGIPLHRKITHLHFLHGTVWQVPQGTPVGSYVLRFLDGQQQVFPVVYGVDVRDWHSFPRENAKAERVIVAWEGSNPAASLNKGVVQLTRSTFENPRPQVEVASLDFVSAMTDSAPFLVALTVE